MRETDYEEDCLQYHVKGSTLGMYEVKRLLM